MIALFKWTRLHPAICTCTVKVWLNISPFLWPPLGLLLLARVQKKGELNALPLPSVWGFGSVAAACLGEGKVGSLLTVPLCRLLGAADHSATSYSKIVSMGTACVAGAAVTHSTIASCSVAKAGTMALLQLGI